MATAMKRDETVPVEVFATTRPDCARASMAITEHAASTKPYSVKVSFSCKLPFYCNIL